MLSTATAEAKEHPARGSLPNSWRASIGGPGSADLQRKAHLRMQRMRAVFRKRLGKERFEAIFNFQFNELVRQANELLKVERREGSHRCNISCTNARPKKGSQRC